MNSNRIDDHRSYHQVSKNIIARCIVDNGYNGSTEKVGIALVDICDTPSGICEICMVATYGYYRAPGAKPVFNKEQAIAQLKKMDICRLIVEI